MTGRAVLPIKATWLFFHQPFRSDPMTIPAEIRNLAGRQLDIWGEIHGQFSNSARLVAYEFDFSGKRSPSCRADKLLEITSKRAPALAYPTVRIENQRRHPMVAFLLSLLTPRQETTHARVDEAGVGQKVVGFALSGGNDISGVKCRDVRPHAALSTTEGSAF